MADQCIICLEDLALLADLTIPPSHLETKNAEHPEPEQPVAKISPCGHVLHDECLRAWSQKANSCPICRHNFNMVQVLDLKGKFSTRFFICACHYSTTFPLLDNSRSGTQGALRESARHFAVINTKGHQPEAVSPPPP